MWSNSGGGEVGDGRFQVGELVKYHFIALGRFKIMSSVFQ